MSAGEEATTPQPMMTGQITITMGFDEDGDPAVWVDPQVSSIVEGLGMLEYAKASLLRLHAEGGGE